MDVIAEKGLEAPVLQAIVRGIKRRAAAWDVMDLNNLLAGSSLLTHAPDLGGFDCKRSSSTPCPHLPIQGGFEEFVRARSQLARFRLAGKLKKLFARETIRHVAAADPEAVSRGLRDLFLLHKMRSDSKGMRTNFASADVERFHLRLGPLFLKEGILQLHLLYGGETPVDAHYSFRYGNKLLNYQQGFNPSYANLSVGALSLYLEMRQAFAEGLSEYDFLKGEESYKFLWTDVVRPQFSLKVYGSTRRGSFCRSKDRLVDFLRGAKSALKKIARSAARD
jgi:CelD/BcsL family acetyltransferase involved in cellulose biosynthesis